jgi:hypothetical protein
MAIFEITKFISKHKKHIECRIFYWYAGTGNHYQYEGNTGIKRVAYLMNQQQIFKKVQFCIQRKLNLSL